MSQLESSLSTLHDIFKKERQISHSSFIDNQKRLDSMEYKSVVAERNYRDLQSITSVHSLPKNNWLMPAESKSGTANNDVIVLKQLMEQQKQAGKEQQRQQQTHIEELSLKQLKLEQEIRALLNRQTQEHNQKMINQADELRMMDSSKERKLEEQNQSIRKMMGNLESKMMGELTSRVHTAEEMKRFMEDKAEELKK